MNAPGRFIAIHHRHLHIHQHDIEYIGISLLQELNGLLTVMGQHHSGTLVLQHILQHHPVEPVILNGHHRDARQAVASCLDYLRSLFLRLLRLGQRQTHLKGAALAGFALDCNRPTHQLDEVTADGKPQPGTTKLTGRCTVGLLKGGKDAGNLCTVQANPGVGHPEAGP